MVEKADTVYRKGKILTVDDNFSIASAMAIKGDRFTYAGSDAEVAEHIGDKTVVHDLKGKTVTPGLNDSHMHLRSLVERILKPPIEVLDFNLEEIQSVIASEVAKAKPGEWIQASRYSVLGMGTAEPHKDLLDSVSPDNPVYLRSYCGHACWVNSRALELAGITDETPQPERGHIVRDADGHATGVFQESSAKELVESVIPQVHWTEEEQKKALVTGSEALFAVGLTSVQDATRTTMETVNRRKALYNEDRLKLRINDMLSEEVARELGAPQTGLYDNRYTLRMVKYLADGSMTARSAAMIEDFSDMPGWRGLLLLEEEPFSLDVAECLKMGFTVHTHTIGDLAIRMALNAYEKAIASTGVENARLSIAHGQFPHPDDTARFAKLGVVYNSTPLWVLNRPAFYIRLGPERARFAYPFKTILEQGGVVVFGTDYGVTHYNPWPNLECAITRQGKTDSPVINPWERLNREEALRCYTINCAYMSFEEDIKGSIEAGKLADFVVINRDYMTCPATEIGDIEVLMTVLGGEVVYTAEGS